MSQTVYETSVYNMVKIIPAENIFMELATKHFFIGLTYNNSTVIRLNKAHMYEWVS